MKRLLKECRGSICIILPSVLATVLIWTQGNAVPATPPSLVPLSGIVQIHGKPVSDALVAIVPQQHGGNTFKPLIFLPGRELKTEHPTRENVSPIASVTTGDDGRWEVFVPPGSYTVAINVVRNTHLFQDSRRTTAKLGAQLAMAQLSNYGAFKPALQEKAVVFYATDRKQGDQEHIFSNAYGDGTLKYGHCRVGIGTLGSINCTAMTHTELIDAIRDRLSRSAFGKVIVWIHGFNSDFRDAIRAGAVIAKGADAPVLAYDWASAKSIPKYAKDEDAVSRTRADAKETITSLYSHVGGNHLAIFSHSLGARLSDEILDYLSDKNEAVSAAAFAAADIDRDTIRSDMLSMRQATPNLTSYASSRDVALMLSENFHFGARLGQTQPPPVFVAPGLVSIDASFAQTDWLGHGYFEDPELLKDIVAALAGQPAIERKALHRDAGGWWDYLP